MDDDTVIRGPLHGNSQRCGFCGVSRDVDAAACTQLVVDPRFLSESLGPSDMKLMAYETQLLERIVLGTGERWWENSSPNPARRATELLAVNDAHAFSPRC